MRHGSPDRRSTALEERQPLLSDDRPLPCGLPAAPLKRAAPSFVVSGTEWPLSSRGHRRPGKSGRPVVHPFDSLLPIKAGDRTRSEKRPSAVEHRPAEGDPQQTLSRRRWNRSSCPFRTLREATALVWSSGKLSLWISRVVGSAVRHPSAVSQCLRGWPLVTMDAGEFRGQSPATRRGTRRLGVERPLAPRWRELTAVFKGSAEARNRRTRARSARRKQLS